MKTNRRAAKLEIINSSLNTKTRNGPLIRIETGRISIRQRRETTETLGLPGLITQGALGEWPLIQVPQQVAPAKYVVIRKGQPSVRHSDLYFVPIATAATCIRADGATLPRLMVSSEKRRQIEASAQGPRLKSLDWDLITLPLEAYPAPWFGDFSKLVEIQLLVEETS